MASVRIWGGLKAAQAVLAIIECLMDEDASDEFDIYVGGFRNGRNATGLSLALWDGSRKCNVLGAPNSDAIVAVIGVMEDFDYEHGTAKETAQQHSFAHDKYYDVARFVVDWLCKGEVNVPGQAG